ncbi:MAG: DUF2949 domain-containing protein [Cyanobacteria bacterium P01_C01_bin.120]
MQKAVNIRNANLIKFLQDELDISQASINVALRHCEQDPGPLPMVLWQYGLVSLKQLEQIYDWMEAA